MSSETRWLRARSGAPARLLRAGAVLLPSAVLLASAVFLGSAVVLTGCSSTESERSLSCGRNLDVCDISRESCRSAVLDSVACLRGYKITVPQPEVTFITVEELRNSSSEEVDDADVTLRHAYSLFDLVATKHVEPNAALTSAVNSIAAFYSAESKRVFILEDPGGESLDERQLGMPVDVYRMTVLAHEYVHFLQDNEFDLERYSADLPTAFDPRLARISAVEGEAALFEGLFTLDLAGRQVDEPRILERLKESLDSTDEAVRNGDSPYLLARYAFPYTYGAHSSAVLYFDGGQRALARLRRVGSTLEYLQRKAGASLQMPSKTLPEPNEFSGLELVSEDELGPWLFGVFSSRVGGVSTSSGQAAAMNWQADRLQVWRTRGDELLAQWVIELTPTDSGDGETTARRWKGPLQEGKPEATPTWLVRASERQLSITVSTREGSEAAVEVADAWGPDDTEETAEPTDMDGESAPLELNSNSKRQRDSTRETSLPRQRRASSSSAAVKVSESEGITTHDISPLTSFPSLSNPTLLKRRHESRERLRRYVQTNFGEARRHQ